MDGESETDFPSNVICQSVGSSGVTTSLPHPQQHPCTTVAKGIDTYNTPSVKASGM